MSPADHRREHDALLLANRQRAEIAERARVVAEQRVLAEYYRRELEQRTRAAADRISPTQRFRPFPSEQFRRLHIAADAGAQSEPATTNRAAAFLLAGLAIGAAVAWAFGFTGHLW